MFIFRIILYADDWVIFCSLAPGTIELESFRILQPMSVPKARIRKLLFWAFSDVRDQFAHISVGSAQIALKIS
jgi:hypothetical protein